VSVHISGSLSSDGHPITLDMNLVAGRGGRGEITENGLGFKLIRLGNTVYINGSEAFTRRVAGARAARLLRGRWLEISAASGEFAALASLTDLRSLIAGTLDQAHGPLAKGAQATVAGRDAIAVHDRASGTVLYVATSGSPYPIEATKRGSGADRIVFDHWNVPVKLTAPRHTVNLTKGPPKRPGDSPP
jgi:hypothetical protein